MGTMEMVERMVRVPLKDGLICAGVCGSWKVLNGRFLKIRGMKNQKKLFITDAGMDLTVRVKFMQENLKKEMGNEFEK